MPNDPHELELAEAYMSTIDLFLDTYEAYTAVLLRGEEATELRAKVRHYMATWGELIINRADGRTARLLVTVMQQVEELAQEIGAIKAGATERHAMLEEILRRLPPRPVPLEAAHD
jgi:hypothetical protein